MRKNLIVALALALILSMLPCSAAADSVHIERRLSDTLSVDADFILPGLKAAAPARLKTADLTDDKTMNSLAEYFFDEGKEIKSAVYHSGENVRRYTGDEFQDEFLSVYTSGSVHYRNQPIFLRQDNLVSYIRNGFAFPDTFYEGHEYSAEYLEGVNHEGFSREEAYNMAAEALNTVLGPDSELDVELVYQYGLTHEDAETLTACFNQDESMLHYYSPKTDEEGNEIPAPPFNPLLIDDWNEDDDLYFFEFIISLNGLPLLHDANVYALSEFDWFMNPICQVYVSREGGVTFLDLKVCRLDSSGEAQTIMTPEQALDAMNAYFDSIIQVFELVVREAAVEYLAVRSDPNTYELIPVWRLSTDVVYNGVRNPYRTYCFDASTGELIR